MKNFSEWITAYNSNVTNVDSCPTDLLESCTNPEVLCHWLCKFVVTPRNGIGEKYAPGTLHAILGGLRRHQKDVNPAAGHADFNFMAKDNTIFKELHSVCDHTYRNLRKVGIGAKPKQSETLGPEDEEMLWSSGVLGSESPQALLNAVFFYNGKNFLLRGGEEHRNLKISQLQRMTNPDRYVYVETGSKNKQGGINDIRQENKIVPMYANPSIGSRCHVHLLDVYLSKLPEGARQRDLFYVRPAKKNGEWYEEYPLGKNRLNMMLKSMCKEAGIKKENITNHSLCATGTTNLFEAGVPEHIIKKRTGHSSLDALRKYERVSQEQEKMVSKILTEGSSWEQKTSKANGPTGVTMNGCKVVFVQNTGPLFHSIANDEDDFFDSFVRENWDSFSSF